MDMDDKVIHCSLGNTGRRASHPHIPTLCVGTRAYYSSLTSHVSSLFFQSSIVNLNDLWSSISNRQSQPWVDRLTLQRQHAKHALVDAAQRLAADEALEGLDAQRELPQGH